MKFYTGVSTLRSILAVGLVTATLATSTAYANNSCKTLLGGMNRAGIPYTVLPSGKIKISARLGALFLDAASSQINSTTGNRTEFKRTVRTEDLQKHLQELSRTFKLEPRDRIKPGYVNVTVTEYLNLLSFEYKGKDLDVKIRFRKYGKVKEGQAITMENIVIDPNMQDVSFVEYKIDHPDFDYSVLKPRSLMQDENIKLIGTPEFLKSLRSISQSTLQLNSEKGELAESVPKMLSVLRELHEAGVPLKYDSRTAYKRVSYSLPVTDNQTKKNYEIQITVDENILLYSYSHNVVLDVYKSAKPLAVTEIKIPVQMVNPKSLHEDSASTAEAAPVFYPSFADNIPELRAIQAFLDNLSSSQVAGYEKNKGKQSLIKKTLNPSTAKDEP